MMHHISLCVHLWSTVLIKGGVLISWGSFVILHYVAGTMHSVLIKGGVLISGVVLYTFLCSWDHA